MRTSLLLVLGLGIAVGCGSSDDDTSGNSGGSAGALGQGATAGAAAGSAGLGGTNSEAGVGAMGEPAGAGAGGDNGRGEIGTPLQIATGQATLQGVTTDGWVVLRSGDVLRAAKMDDPQEAQDITNKPGSVLIRGRVVFNWADVNWEQGVGDLSVWTSEAGVHHVGLTPYSETLVGASEDGSTIVYTANTHEVGDGAGGAGSGGAPAEGGAGTGGAGEAGMGGAPTANKPEKVTDLVIAASDLSAKKVLIASLGLGSENTCNPSFGFVGQRLMVGWCASGSRDAKIERYEQKPAGWTPTIIAENALPNWSTDATGDSVFYQSNGYAGFVNVNGKASMIDAGVSAGTLLPDGKAVLYSVGDQLRRTDLVKIKPITVVTTGYKQPITFSTDFGLALYSTTVTYEHGTQRDLLLTTTGSFNPQPLVLVSEPVATLARSSLSRDGKYVFWLTDVTPRGGTLHVVDGSGAEVTTLPGVVEAAAGKGSLLVFTDNASDPEKYPVVADLKVIDLGHERTPQVIETKVLDGKNFQVDASGSIAAYVRSGIARDPADPTHDGVFTVTLP